MEFTKIQGAGNDFIIIDNRNHFLSIEECSALAKTICRRKYSIGADGFISIEHPKGSSDFKMNFFNSDGTIAEMCGNGARCAARFFYENNLKKSIKRNYDSTNNNLKNFYNSKFNEISIEVDSGNVTAWRIDKRKYKIKLDNPNIINLENSLNINGIQITYSYIELGDPGLPHVIIKYNNLINLKNCDIFDIAKKIRENKIFNKGTNVSFYDIIDNCNNLIDNMTQDRIKNLLQDKKNTILIRTYERGVEDFTLACGTAAGAAAVVIALKNEAYENNICFLSEGGELKVQVTKRDKNTIEDIFLIGDTNIIASGKIIDENIEENLWKKLDLPQFVPLA